MLVYLWQTLNDICPNIGLLDAKSCKLLSSLVLGWEESSRVGERVHETSQPVRNVDLAEEEEDVTNGGDESNGVDFRAMKKELGKHLEVDIAEEHGQRHGKVALCSQGNVTVPSLINSINIIWGDLLEVQGGLVCFQSKGFLPVDHQTGESSAPKAFHCHRIHQTYNQPFVHSLVEDI